MEKEWWGRAEKERTIDRLGDEGCYKNSCLGKNSKYRAIHSSDEWFRSNMFFEPLEFWLWQWAGRSHHFIIFVRRSHCRHTDARYIISFCSSLFVRTIYRADLFAIRRDTTVRSSASESFTRRVSIPTESSISYWSIGIRVNSSWPRKRKADRLISS